MSYEEVKALEFLRNDVMEQYNEMNFQNILDYIEITDRDFGTLWNFIENDILYTYIPSIDEVKQSALNAINGFITKLSNNHDYLDNFVIFYEDVFDKTYNGPYEDLYLQLDNFENGFKIEFDRHDGEAYPVISFDIIGYLQMLRGDFYGEADDFDDNDDNWINTHRTYNDLKGVL